MVLGADMRNVRTQAASLKWKDHCPLLRRSRRVYQAVEPATDSFSVSFRYRPMSSPRVHASMAGRTAGLALILASLMLVACAQNPPEERTPDVAATVQPAMSRAVSTAAFAPTPDMQATIKAGVQATMEALAPTTNVTLTPTYAPIPMPTPTPTPTNTPTSTPTPITAVLPSQFSMAAAMLRKNDFPEGTGLFRMKWKTPEELNPANPADEIAKTWGFNGSHSVEYIRHTASSYTVYLARVVLYDSVEGAQKAVYERWQYLDAALSQETDFAISELLSSRIGTQTKAFKIRIERKDLERMAHIVVFNRHNVLGVIWIETVGSKIDMIEPPILADRLDSLILEELRSPSGPTTFRTPTPTPAVLPIPTPAASEALFSSVLATTTSINLEGLPDLQMLIDLPYGWTLGDAARSENDRITAFKWLDAGVIAILPTALNLNQSIVAEMVKSMATSDNPNARIKVGTLNGMSYSEKTEWKEGTLRRTMFIAVGNTILGVQGTVRLSAVDALWPSITVAMNSIRPAPQAPLNPTPVSSGIPSPTPLSDALHSIANIVESTRDGVVRIAGTTGSGSGFVVDSAGYILTNEHVIDGAGLLTVIFDDGTRVAPRVVALDSVRDIALLKVESTRRLTALPFATEAREGEEVVALGYPLDLAERLTVTRGIVSAFRNYEGRALVQTDAATNPGNSGGPLLNLKGEVIGMNTFVRREIQGRDYDAQGIGFAIRYDVLSSRLALMMSGASLESHSSIRVPEGATVVDHTIQGARLSHTSATIKAGGFVRWSNKTDVAHTVTHTPTIGGQARLFDAHIQPDDSFVYQFNDPGEYRYACLIHPVQMWAVITVVQ